MVVSNVHISIYVYIPISHDASLSTREGDEIERSQKREINEGERERERLLTYIHLSLHPYLSFISLLSLLHLMML